MFLVAFVLHFFDFSLLFTVFLQHVFVVLFVVFFLREFFFGLHFVESFLLHLFLLPDFFAPFLHRCFIFALLVIFVVAKKDVQNLICQ